MYRIIEQAPYILVRRILKVMMFARMRFVRLVPVCLALCAVALTAYAQSQPAGTNGEGLRVHLELPWTTIMAGESIQSRFTLENVCGSPVPVAYPTSKYGIGAPVGGQPYFEAIPRRVTPEIDMTKAQWPPIDQMMGSPMADWGELPAGHRITWNENRLPAGIFGVYATKGLEAVKAHWLAGPNTWVSSDPIPVKIVEVPASKRKQVFEAQWSSYGLNKNTRNGIAFVVPLEGKHFLFFERYRVCQVGPDDQFSHSIDKDGTNLEVTIKGQNTTRKVYFHLRHGLTRDTPWPIGPLQLFLPSPEAIPDEELTAIRAELNRGDSEPLMPKTQQSHSEHKKKAGETQLSLYWLIAGGVLMAILGFVILMRKKSVA